MAAPTNRTSEELTAIINSAIEQNQENFLLPHEGYDTGYIHGYHDALVDLMNRLELECKWELYND